MSRRRNIIFLLSIIALAAGTLSGRGFLYKIGYVFIGLTLISLVYSWFSVNWLSMGRNTYSRRIQVGQIFEEHLMVSNQSFMPKLWLEVRDHSTLPNHRVSHVVPLLNFRGHYRWGTETVCVRRGQFTLGPITIVGGDPFGLYQFPRHIATTSNIIVYPKTYPIYDFTTPTGALTGGQAVRRLSYEITPHAAGIREYAPGDSIKRIHWKSSARRNKLFVKEFEMDPLGDVWIFLDLSRESVVARPSAYSHTDHRTLPPSTEEYAISIAGSLAQYFISHSRTVGFMTYTPHREYIAPDRGDRQLTDILEVLATASSQTDISLGQMLALEAPHITKGSTVVLVSSSTNLNWLTEAHIQSRRGMLVIAVLIDPTSFGMSDVDFDLMRRQVETAGFMTYVVKQGDDLSTALSYELSHANGN